MGPIPGVLGINGLLDSLDLLAFLVHCIRIQRNVLADFSADAVAICIAVQIVSVPWIHIATAITGHSFQQFRNFLGNPIDLGHLTGE
jgi:hypothetical protein